MWSVTDPESAVTKTGCVDQNITADQAANTYSCSASSVGGSAGPVDVTIKRDKTAPGVSWSGGIADGATFTYGSVPAAPTCTATDALSGPASCDVTDYGASVGGHTLTATAYDMAGNVKIEKRSYTVTKANASVVVTPYDVTYDGNPHTATGMATGVMGEDLSGLLDLSGTTHTDAGFYAGDPWSFAGNENYEAASGTVDDNISKASSTVTISCPVSVVYNGSAQEPCTATVTGAGGLNQAVAVTYSNNTNAGTATASASYAGDGNHDASSNSTTFEITKAEAVCTVTGYTGVYDGNPHGASGSCTGVMGETLAGLDLGGSFTNVPGGIANWVFTDVTGNYNDQSGTADIVITKADAVCSITGYSGVYDAAYHGASGSCSGVGGEDAGVLNLGATFKDVPGGTANWTFTGNGNYNDQSGSVAITITKRPITVTADAKSKILNAPDPAFTYQITSGNLVGSDSFSGGLTREAGEAVGQYDILQGTLTAGSNYNLTYVPAKLTITYAPFGSLCYGAPGHSILQPINSDGTSVFKQKSTVPAKFRVCDAYGNSIGTQGVVMSFKLVQIITGTTPEPVFEDVVSTTPDTAFRWSSSDQQWIFNINTKSLSPGKTYVYLITLNDGTTIEFKFGLK
ncbi:MAG: hypothetical protein C3F07_20770 [Anaerolineales bacterium]|nr:MAG: hypothetical protein C3F07_20770 [Anaerolineales bacterium]